MLTIMKVYACCAVKIYESKTKHIFQIGWHTPGSAFEKGRVLHLKKKGGQLSTQESLSPKYALCYASLVEIDPMVLEAKFDF